MTSLRVGSLVLTGANERPAEVGLSALVEEYSTLLFRVAYAVLRSPAEAEDVVQDANVGAGDGAQQPSPDVHHQRNGGW